MATPRRRLIRPTSFPMTSVQKRVRKLRDCLEREHLALARWQSKLRRAFNRVAKINRRIVQLERQLAKTENT
jgi:hypothetical protein